MDRFRVRNNDEYAMARVHSTPLGESEVPIFARIPPTIWRAREMTRQLIGEKQLTIAAVVLACFVTLVGGCATTQKKGPAYAEQVMNRPLPVTDAEKQQECSWLYGEMARQRRLAGYGTSTQDLGTLELRASQVGCRATPGANTPQASGASYQACHAKCRQGTNKSNDMCFDECTK